MARADDAVETRFAGQRGKADDLVVRGAANADIIEIGRVEAGEHGDADHLGRASRDRLGLFHHRAAARSVDGQDRGFERTQRLDRLGNGVRDVMQLEVEEDRQAELRHFVHPVMAVGAEEFEAELQPADMVAHPLRQRQRGIEVGVSMAR